MYHTNRDQKKAGVAILISDKMDFKTKAVERQRRPLHNDQRINPRRCKIINIYAPNVGAPQYMTNANKYERGN